MNVYASVVCVCVCVYACADSLEEPEGCARVGSGRACVPARERARVLGRAFISV